MTQQPDLNQLSAEQLRTLAAQLMASLAAKDRALTHSTALNDKLTHELAILKRHKYARRSEQFSAVQGLLLDELVDSDLAAIEVEQAWKSRAPPWPNGSVPAASSCNRWWKRCGMNFSSIRCSCR